MIKITHIKWSRRAIGISAAKMRSGPNMVSVTVTDKSGNLLIPEPFRLDREIAIAKYGPIEKINEPSLMGVWIPLRDIEDGTVNEINNAGNTPAEEEPAEKLPSQGNGETDEPAEPTLF